MKRLPIHLTCLLLVSCLVAGLATPVRAATLVHAGRLIDGIGDQPRVEVTVVVEEGEIAEIRPGFDGAVISGSFQAFDQDYLVDALSRLGPAYVGVTQLPAAASDEELKELDSAGVRAVRFNLKRGGSPSTSNSTRCGRMSVTSRGSKSRRAGMCRPSLMRRQ